MIKMISQIDEIERVIQEENIVVGLFSDLGCNVCLAITPELEKMSEAFPKVAFVSVDVKLEPSLVSQYLVLVYPTIILFTQGKEAMRYERLVSLDQLEATIERYDTIMNGD